MQSTPLSFRRNPFVNQVSFFQARLEFQEREGRRNPFVNQVSFFQARLEFQEREGRRNPFVNQVSFFGEINFGDRAYIESVAIPS